jgi:beta-1,4-mannosyltransferase
MAVSCGDREGRTVTTVAALAKPTGLGRSWRPSFISFILVYLTFFIIAWRSFQHNPGIGYMSWYTTVVWSLPVLTSAPGLAGAVITGHRMRRRHRLSSVPAVVLDLLVVVVPTIGRQDTYPALERAVHSYCRCLPAYFPRLRIDIVIEEACEDRDRIAALEIANSLVRVVTVPRDYHTKNGTRFKARANQYAHALRLAQGEATDDVWVLHMDDDTGVGPDTAESVGRFISEQALTGKHGLHLAQGVLAYPREYARSRLTWLADAVRPGCDISLFAAATGRGSPHAGLHGELLLVRASVEATIGWDFGPRTIVEDAQFSVYFCDRYPGRSDWFPGRSYGASPATVADFVRQRERWVWGLLELATKRSIPLRRRLPLLQNVMVWACGPIQHPVVILLAGALLGDMNTAPASAVVVPLWALNIAYCIWLYWEGLKVNALSSSLPGRLWWEPLCLVMLIPLFSLLEVAGIFLGVSRFLRNGESTFTVIAKPV